MQILEKKVPGLCCSTHDETDWEFLCRLATRILKLFLIEEPAGEYGQIYFGMPSFDFWKADGCPSLPYNAKYGEISILLIQKYLPGNDASRTICLGRLSAGKPVN